ncbi:MAG: DUF3592 domain-containing protein [Roseiflexus sp.]
MVPVRGRVVESKRVEKYDDDGTSVVFHAVVEFSTFEGETIRFQSSVGTNPPLHRVGDQVKVLYKPSNPQNAVFDSFWHLWFMPTLVCGIGGIMILFTGLELIIWLATLFRLGIIR